MAGKPEFHEGYCNPAALDESLIEFPYDKIDGLAEEDSDWRVVASALVGIMLYLLGEDGLAEEHEEGMLSRFEYLRDKAGLGGALSDRVWALEWVDGVGQADLLLEALRRILPVFEQAGKGSRPASPGMRKGVVAKNAIAFAWMCSPSIFLGKGLKELAREIGVHKNTLSTYTANLSRVFGFRNHAQSKGWNWRTRE